MRRLKWGYLLALLIGILLLAPIAYERVKWGGYIPTLGPNRVEFQGRRYYPNGPQQMKESEVKLMVRSYYWGKNLYVLKRDYKLIDVEHKYPTHMQVFIKDSAGWYSGFLLSGGP